MEGAVKLSEIVESWTSTDPWTISYLDKETGEIIPITHFEFYEAEKPFLAEPQLDGRPDIKQVAKDVQDGDERYLRLPSRSEIEGYAIIREQFCASVEDDRISEILSESLKQIRGEEVFEKTLIRYGMVEDWSAWYCRQQKTAAKEWCENNDVEFIEDI
jgi:hypothetical protein